MNLKIRHSTKEPRAIPSSSGSLLEKAQLTASLAATKPMAATTEPTTTGGMSLRILLIRRAAPTTPSMRPPMITAPHMAGMP